MANFFRIQALLANTLYPCTIQVLVLSPPQKFKQSLALGCVEKYAIILKVFAPFTPTSTSLIIINVLQTFIPSSLTSCLDSLGGFLV
jgi:hypothetical protein